MVTRTNNRRGEGENLRRDLIRAATELLINPQTIDAPSLRAIARACGVSPSGVYLHFASQNDLLLAVIEAQYDELRQALVGSDRPSATAEQRLKAMARTYVTWGLEHPGAYQLLFESADVFPDDITFVGPGMDLLDRVGELIQAHSGMRTAASRRLAFRLWAGLHGLTSLRIHKPHAPWATTATADSAALVAALLNARP